MKTNKTKCYSVRLESLISISTKAYKARSFDGREQILPKSVVFGQDWGVQKSDAWWIAAWFLEKPDVDIQYSSKKVGWHNPANGKVEPPFGNAEIVTEHHVPDPITPDHSPVDDLNK
jgi:hypothetical protein